MPDTSIPLGPESASAATEADGWRAELALAYEFDAGRSVLSKRRHYGPLRVQKPLYPEGDHVCHTIIVHPPGGIAGGDRLAVNIGAGPRSHVLVTTPGAAKWYKANRREARQTVRLAIADAALVEWLPQESIVFDGARVRITTEIDLAENSRYLGWELTVLGRRASGEEFSEGCLRSTTSIRLAGREIFCEASRVEGGSELLRSPAGFAGHHVTGTLLAAGIPCPDDVLAACRDIAPEAGARYGLSRVPGALIARYLGSSPQDARAYFTALWLVLRPWLAGRAGHLPRIWQT